MENIYNSAQLREQTLSFDGHNSAALLSAISCCYVRNIEAHKVNGITLHETSIKINEMVNKSDIRWTMEGSGRVVQVQIISLLKC